MNGRPEEIGAITLRRGPCFGFCPAYEVTLAADGGATWRGDRFVDRIGRYEGEVAAQDFLRVAAFVERAGFFEWDPEYTSGAVDAPEYHLVVHRGEQAKAVRQHGIDEPPEFWVVAALVDGLVTTVDWKPAPPDGAAQSIEGNSLDSYRQLPTPESCRLLDFDDARVITLRVYPPRYIVTVSGTKPWLSMDVDLVPRQYVRQPEYYGIEVVGCLRDVGPPVLAPYSVSLELDGAIGTRGIEVIGGARSVTIDVPAAQPVHGAPQCFDWVAYHDHEPPGPATLRVIGTCLFGRTGYTVALRRAEPQGVNPGDLILDLDVDEPDVGAHVLTEVEARYEEVTDVEYDTVTIRPGPTIAVQEVH